MRALSVVIPAYNEQARLGKTLREVFAYLNEQTPDSELIVVDDGSTDDTSAIAERSFAGKGSIEARLIRVHPNRGKGHAVRAGLLTAQAPIALFSDADLSTPISETPKLVEPIRAGEFDVVFGSRALDRSLIGVHQPWRREQSGRLFNLAVRLATGLPYWDTQCGFKAFRMSVCRAVVEAARIDRFGFDVELLHIAHAAGLRLSERAVRWNDAEGSTLTVMRGLHAFGEIRAVSRNARKGVYREAIERVREVAAREGTLQQPFVSSDFNNTYIGESDASPELASPANRI